MSNYSEPGSWNQPHHSNFDAQASTPSADERSMAVMAHASAVIAMIVSAGWLSFVGPLAVWLLYKDRSPFVRQAAAASFNFNIGMWVMSIIAWILVFTVIGIPISIALWGLAFVLTLVCHIAAALRAKDGQLYNYPFQLRLLS